MDGIKLALLAAGLLIGGFVVMVVRLGAQAAPAPMPTRDVDLVDGKYLVLHSDYGNWVYEKTDAGFKPVIKELSPLGLQSIWGLQGAYKPQSIGTAKGEVLYVPYTSYSTETGSFNTQHKFFHMTDAGLVEVPLTTAPTPAAAPTGR
jgi:hypothetical protein